MRFLVLTVLSSSILLFSGGAQATLLKSFESALSKAHNFMPSDYTRWKKRFKKNPEDAKVALRKFISDSSSNPQGVFFACECISELPDQQFLGGLRQWTIGKDWVVRSACAGAFAKVVVSNSVSDENFDYILDRMYKEMREAKNTTDCGVASSIAEELGKIGNKDLHTVFMSAATNKKNWCFRNVGYRGLLHDKVDKAATVEFAFGLYSNLGNPEQDRSKGLRLLKQQGSDRALAMVRADLKRVPKQASNFFTDMILYIGEFGDKTDISDLKNVIKNDPYDGAGVWAVKSRESIQKLKRK